MKYRNPAILAVLLIEFIVYLLVVIDFDEFHVAERGGTSDLPVPYIAILCRAQKLVRRCFRR